MNRKTATNAKTKRPGTRFKAELIGQVTVIGQGDVDAPMILIGGKDLGVEVGKLLAGRGAPSRYTRQMSVTGGPRRFKVTIEEMGGCHVVQ